MDKPEAITGVFSTQEIKRVGTGTTTRKSIHKSFWYCQELESGAEEGKIEIQPLNANYIPAGPKRVVDKEQFLSGFSPEPEFYVSTVFPRMREINKTVARADRHRKNKEYYSAEMEYNNALKVDEENVRANFGLGLTYLQRNETDKADNIFSRLVKLDAAFEQEHKHLFNEFGIQLRKNGMFDQAKEYYTRALDLSSTDENIYYNMARAELESDRAEAAVDMLLKGLAVNPNMEEAARFLIWMLGKNLVPDGKKNEVASALRRVKEAQDAAPATPQPAPAAAPEEEAAPADDLPAAAEAKTAEEAAPEEPAAPAGKGG